MELSKDDKQILTQYKSLIQKGKMYDVIYDLHNLNVNNKIFDHSYDSIITFLLSKLGSNIFKGSNETVRGCFWDVNLGNIDIFVPDNVKIISSETFINTIVNSITLTSIRKIEPIAFLNTNANTICLPESIQFIGKNAFNGYSGIITCSKRVQDLVANSSNKLACKWNILNNGAQKYAFE